LTADQERSGIGRENWWRAHLERRRLLKWSRARYCGTNQLSVHQLTYCERKLTETADPGSVRRPVGSYAGNCSAVFASPHDGLVGATGPATGGGDPAAGGAGANRDTGGLRSESPANGGAGTRRAVMWPAATGVKVYLAAWMTPCTWPPVRSPRNENFPFGLPPTKPG